MMTRTIHTNMSWAMRALVYVTMFTIATALIAGERDFKAEGTYVKGYSCPEFKPTDVTTVQEGCEAIGGILFTGGKYMDVELNEARLAFGAKVGEWVRVYVQAKNPVQREAVIAFARDYLSSVGKIDSAREAKIELNGKDGEYSLVVDNGNIIQLTTKPVIGGDNKNPIAFTNTRDRLSPKTLYQGQTMHGSFSDGDRKFELKNAAAIFNNDLDSKGSFPEAAR